MNHQLNISDLESVQEYLWRQALYYTNDKNSAKDLVQETLYKALTKIHLFKPNTNFKAWTSTILRNNFITNYKKRKKYEISDLESSYEVLLNKQQYNSGEFLLLKSEINEMLNDLSQEEQVVIKLRRKGYSYQDIANQLELPIGTIKSRIHIARKKLKRKFETLN